MCRRDSDQNARLARLDWSREQRLALRARLVLKPACARAVHAPERIVVFLPLGSEDDAIRAQGLEIGAKRFSLWCRTLGFASFNSYGHDAYAPTRKRRFRDGLKESVDMASRARVMLAMEIMDYPLMNSISKALGWCSLPQPRGSALSGISATHCPR